MSAAQRRAEQLLKSAEALFTLGDYDSAVSRAYYAVFHVVRAVLRADELLPKTHKGLHALVQSRLVPSGKISPEDASDFRSAWSLRDLGDYAEEPVATEETAATVIADAHRIVAALAAPDA